MTKPTILVTGGAGYIGSHAVLALHDAGWPVVVADNLSNGRREAIPEGVPLVEVDVGDAGAMADLFAAHPITAIMHFAGSIVVPDSVTDPHYYYGNNTVATHSLIGSAMKAGVDTSSSPRPPPPMARPTPRRWTRTPRPARSIPMAGPS